MEKIICFFINLHTSLFILFNNGFVEENLLNFFKILFLLFYLAFLFKETNIFFKIDQNKKYLLAFLFSILLFIVFKRMYLSILIIIAIGLKKKMFSLYFLQNIILLSIISIIIILCSKLNLIENKTFIYGIYGYEGFQKRQSLGFNNPNTIGIIFFVIRSGYYYLKFNKLKYYNFIILGILNYILYTLTYSRTMIVVFICEVLIFYILKYKYNIIKKIMKLGPFFHFIGTLIAIFVFNDSIFDKVLSKRLSYSYDFFCNTSFINLLFGNKEKFYLPLDNSYVNLIHDYGLIISLIIVFLLTKGIKNLLLNENDEECKRIIYIFLIYLTYSVSEAILFNIYYSFITIILLGYSLGRQIEKND